MKRFPLYIIFSLISISSFSQIGIWTENIQSGILLQIDSGKDNPTVGAPNSSQALNDIVISTAGNVGIGTTSPTAKLHIVTGGTSSAPNPQLRIDDGTAQTNRVLMSSPNGTTQWEDYIPGFTLGTMSAAGLTIPTTGIGNTTFVNTNATIILSPGQWFIYFTVGMLCNGTTTTSNYRIWPQVTIADPNTLVSSTAKGYMTPDAFTNIQYSNNVVQGMRGSINGWVGINNTSGADRTYYVLCGYVQRSNAALNLSRIMSKDDGYSTLFAFRVKQ